MQISPLQSLLIVFFIAILVTKTNFHMPIRKYKIEIKWALIFSVASLVWMMIERLTGLHSTHIAQHATYTNLFAIPCIGIYVWALIQKRNASFTRRITHLQAFVSGLIMTGIITLLSPLTQVITSYVITPYYFGHAITYAVQQNELTLAEAEAFFSLGNYIKQALIGAPVMGLFTSALAAFFIGRRKRF